MFYKKLSKISIVLILTINACLPSNNFEKKYCMPNYGWTSKNILQYNFCIKDTNSNYNLFFLLKHTYAYPYCNIWINLYTTLPCGKNDTTKLEIPLATTSGEWMGKSVNKIVEQKLNIGPNAGSLHFKQMGNYKIQIQQIMRQDTLPSVSQSGLSLERLSK